MRVYKFLDTTFGLKSLAEKRLKISRFDDLNDPFELIPYNLSNRRHRWALKATRNELGQHVGVLCFSATWRDPVLWAHYAEKHQGLCIEFELPEGNKHFRKIEYVRNRLPFPQSLTPENAKIIAFTKYDRWEYEQEIRAFSTLINEENGLYFKDFDDTLRLVRVIAGARCKLSKNEILKALGTLAKKVKVIKARAGFTKFEIVRDERGFQ
ncbi:MAG TPA: DUF2971 domain-containing protein [Terriglobales bacterium]|nr:DUF2971 domain-containing protein [Terriglobales bacterium]